MIDPKCARECGGSIVQRQGGGTRLDQGRGPIANESAGVGGVCALVDGEGGTGTEAHCGAGIRRLAATKGADGLRQAGQKAQGGRATAQRRQRDGGRVTEGTASGEFQSARLKRDGPCGVVVPTETHGTDARLGDQRGTGDGGADVQTLGAVGGEDQFTAAAGLQTPPADGGDAASDLIGLQNTATGDAQQAAGGDGHGGGSRRSIETQAVDGGLGVQRAGVNRGIGHILPGDPGSDRGNCRRGDGDDVVP